MIIHLTYTNALSIPVLIRNNMGQAQPLLPHQPLEMTFDLDPQENGIAELILICEPQP